MNRQIIILILFFIISSCAENKKTEMKSDKLESFKKFIDKFEIIKLPFRADIGCYEPDSLISVPLEMDNDSVFIKYVGPAMTIGVFPDTSNFYTVLYCTAASCYMPTIAVFSKEGELLAQELVTKGCGAGVGYSCYDSLIIYSSKSFKQIFYEESVESDENGNEIKNSIKKIKKIYHYSIENNGKIETKVEDVE